MPQQIKLSAKISNNQFGQRLDQALTKVFSNYSRSYIKKCIIEQRVLINGKIWDKPKKKVFGGEVILMDINIEKNTHHKPQSIPLDIIYEDNDIIIVNKQRDLVVHPGAGNPDGTMLNALLYYYPPLIDIPRNGIIHRLDKNTTGLMIIAKTIQAQTFLTISLKLRKIIREYEAIVTGKIKTDGIINASIMRHPKKPTKMFIHPMGRAAVTHYHIMENFRLHTRLRVRIETGRTHQIRVHMSYISHPLVGDQLYGGNLRVQKDIKTLVDILEKFDRQALHAKMLRFYHPISGVAMEWYAPIPQDMMELIDILRADFNNYIK